MSIVNKAGSIIPSSPISRVFLDAIKDIEISLMGILDNISSISGMNHQVATNSQEQSYVAEEKNVNVVRINDLSEQNALQTE